MAAAIQPEELLKELGKLWQSLAQPEHGAATASGVLRACAMTLITAAEDEADAQQAGEIIAELMHEHPSRAIVLRPNESGELDARVFAQCWMPFGSRQQICCEQIEITAARERLGDVPGLMLGLVAPDLPVVLWCRGTRWFGEPHFNRLIALTDKVIVDSSRFPSPADAFGRISELRARGRRVADLVWSRLTPWRESIAQSADEAAKCGGARTVLVSFGGETAPAEALYLAAWLKRGLPGAAVSAVKAVTDQSGVLSVTLDGVELRPPAKRCASDCEAMREELSITQRDRIFEEVQRDVYSLVQVP